MESVVACKIYEKEVFFKEIISFIKKEHRGVFKYVNVYENSSGVWFALNVKPDKEVPDFLDIIRGKLVKGQSYSWAFVHVKDLVSSFAGFKVDALLSDGESIFLIGEDLNPLEEFKIIREKAKKDEKELKELIEGGLNLSDNPKEIEFIKLIAERLFG